MQKMEVQPLPVIRNIFMVEKGASACAEEVIFNKILEFREDMSTEILRKFQLRIAVVLCFERTTASKTISKKL